MHEQALKQAINLELVHSSVVELQWEEQAILEWEKQVITLEFVHCYQYGIGHSIHQL